MKTVFITFRSVTYAQRGESVLTKGGIGCSLQRTPKWMEELGCGYCLRLGGKDLLRALELLKKQQVAYRKVYGKQGDGKVEEISV